jgi:nucleoid DNA-binding protein
MAKELFGQFLIRRGKVDQGDIDEALVLQDILKDSLGALALANDILSFKDVGKILEYTDTHKVGFSEAAVTLKVLTPAQVGELKTMDRGGRIRLGQLLVATTKLTRRELDEELQLFERDRLLLPSPNITRALLVDQIAERIKMDQPTVKEILEEVFETIKASLAADECVKLRDFGTFRTVILEAREARNPRTGDSLKVGTRRVPRFDYALKIRRMVEKGRKCG